MTSFESIDEHFDPPFSALLDQGRQDFRADRLEDALARFAEAEAIADASADRRGADRAFVNTAAVLVTLKREEGLAPEVRHRLREILMRGEDPVNCRLAAYNVARAYEFAKEPKKGLFYARLALERSELLGWSDWLASSHNQIGNFHLAESRFDAASTAYETALELLADAEGSEEAAVAEQTEGTARARALIEDNLGYARLLLGRRREGLALLYRSLRTLVRLGAGREQISPRLDLAFALLEVERPRPAFAHAARALALAEEAGEADSIKNAHFLLGEAAQATGDQELARSWFQRLQERYFPQSAGLADLLLAVDVRPLVNLKA